MIDEKLSCKTKSALRGKPTRKDVITMAGLNKVTVEDLNVKGKKVLVRVDFNVPLKDGVITNDNRIQAALPTINKLVENGAKVVLCSHLGKPKNGPEEKFSLKPAADRLAELVSAKVTFANDDTVVGDNAKAAVAAMNEGEIVVLQNTRFRGADETKNGEGFAKELADLVDGEVFVMDAFGSAHRAHASTAGVTKFVKETAVGYLMQKEIQYLGNAVEVPVRPFVAILGGAKVADKLNVISNLLEKCDTLIIGGGMAYTFLKAQGGSIGQSLVDDEKLDYCKEMLAKAESLGKKILLPVDTAVAASFPDPIDAEIAIENVKSTEIPADKMGLDIGTETQALFAEAVKSAKTVVWNGPMGVFENPTLAKGTIAVAKALAETDATTIIGGGDSAAAVMQLGFADKMSHISTGGGASLEYLEGKVLPGVDVIADKA
jgi:phosphoglycerate kinase